MKRKDYQKPTMQVVKLEQTCQILAGSPLNATRSDYGDVNTDTWSAREIIGFDEENAFME